MNHVGVYGFGFYVGKYLRPVKIITLFCVQKWIESYACTKTNTTWRKKKPTNFHDLSPIFSERLEICMRVKMQNRGTIFKGPKGFIKDDFLETSMVHALKLIHLFCILLCILIVM